MPKLLLILTLLTTTQAFAYPITPQTLRKQIENSEYIVIAIIDNPDPEGERMMIFDKEKGDSVEVMTMTLWGDGLAHLKILKVLKGNIDLDTIAVNYPAEMMNPRPPNYPDQRKVIAFLQDCDTSINFQTVGLSYGTILFDLDESTEIYENLIKEYLPISSIKRKRKKKQLTASWLVSCCEDRSSRWHGAYELNREEHWMSYYDQSVDNNYSKYLTSEEKRSLEKIVLDSDTISYNELCLSRFVSEENEAALKEVLLRNLEIFRIYFSDDLMKKYLELEENAELRLIYEEYEKLNLTDDKNEAMARVLNTRFVEVGRN